MQALNLTSKFLHRLCQVSIFRTVTIQYQASRNHTTCFPLSKLKEILAGDKVIATLVKSIVVDVKIEILWSPNDDGQWLVELMQMIHERFHQASSLTFTGMEDCMTIPKEDFYTEIFRITSITHLSFIRCCIPNSLFNGIVSHFSCVEHLHVHNHWLGDEDDVEYNLRYVPQPERFPPNLLSFFYHNGRVSGQTTKAFLGWIQPVKNLTTLAFHLDGIEIIPMFGQVLKEIGPSLERLEMRRLEPGEEWRWGKNFVESEHPNSGLRPADQEDILNHSLHQQSLPTISTSRYTNVFTRSRYVSQTTSCSPSSSHKSITFHSERSLYSFNSIP